MEKGEKALGDNQGNSSFKDACFCDNTLLVISYCIGRETGDGAWIHFRVTRLDGRLCVIPGGEKLDLGIPVVKIADSELAPLRLESWLHCAA